MPGKRQRLVSWSLSPRLTWKPPEPPNTTCRVRWLRVRWVHNVKGLGMVPRDNRPPQQICKRCNGRGTYKAPKARRTGGKTVTEMVDEVCPQCGGVGWVNR